MYGLADDELLAILDVDTLLSSLLHTHTVNGINRSVAQCVGSILHTVDGSGEALVGKDAGTMDGCIVTIE